MPRYRLLLEYNGGPYQGWQRLPGIPTVQGALEEAAAKLDGAPVEVHGAGRTDSGVHATGQVAHMDLRTDRGTKVPDAMNFHLRPHPIAVLKADKVDDDFHARFSATQLDADKMHEAAQILVGTHDFTTFRDTDCQAKSPVKTLNAISVSRYGDRVEMTCRSKSFLHRQVRSIMGSLVDVGRGKQPVEWIAEILAAAERTACGPISPPDGLYLEKVDYE